MDAGWDRDIVTEDDQAYDDYTRSRPFHRGLSPEHGQFTELLDLHNLVDDTNDIPSLDEIPYALILAGEIDEQTMMKAAYKQQQKNVLQSMDKKTNAHHISTKTERNKSKKNKNAVLSKKNSVELENVFKSKTALRYSEMKKIDDADDVDTENVSDYGDCNKTEGSRKNDSNSFTDQDDKDRKTTAEGIGKKAEKSEKNGSTSPYTNQDSKVHKTTADGIGKTAKPESERAETSMGSIVNFLSQFLGAVNEDDDFMDDYIDHSREYENPDEEDIPMAMKLGNLAEARRNFFSQFAFADREKTASNRQRQIKNKNHSIISSRSKKEHDYQAYSEKQEESQTVEARELRKEDDPGETHSDNERPFLLLLVSADKLSSSSSEAQMTCEEIETENSMLPDNTEEMIYAVPENNKAGEKSRKLSAETEKDQRDEPPLPQAPTLKLSKDVLKLADSRHVAFKKIRSKTLKKDNLKCTACRRPECTSQNMKKMKEIIKVAEEEGYEVRDVVPDGNCMFAAVVDQLELHGEFNHNAKSLREMAVHWLIENPCSSDGTHYASFLEEDWEKYLQRMINEGQWGDHIVIRAIAQVLKRTIMILNPGASDKRWTRIGADSSEQDVWSSSWVIFLGLAGEFHYMSLLPKEFKVDTANMESLKMESMTAEEMELYSLDGVEDVSMFEEDHVDRWSSLPLAHLSYIVKKLVPVTCVEKAVYNMASLCEENEQIQPALTSGGTQCLVICKPTGEVAEGLYIPQLSKGPGPYHATEILLLSIRQDLRVVERTDPTFTEADYYIDTRGCQPGYTKIAVPANMGTALHTYYMPHHVKGREEEHKCCGASDNLPHVHTKAEAAIPSSWPVCASTWKLRPRREGWPSQALIDSVVDGGCCLIGVPHKLSKIPETEWQFSFAVAEKLLMREGVSANQKYCFILFKAFCYQAMENSDFLTSEHLKQVFFYACERIPADFWSSGLGGCIMYMIDELMKYLTEENLPNYFVPSNNMINYFSKQQIRDAISAVKRLRSEPVVYLRLIDKNYKAIGNGGQVIDTVIDDVPNYLDHKSLRRSTLEVFVPTSIEIAKKHVQNRQYAEGYNMIGQAYEERLAVNTCDDTVPFQIFLTGALSGLREDDLIWLSVYADKHFQGQIPCSLISEISTVDSTVKINKILPNDVTAGYGNSLVPVAITRPASSFCSEFAKFLYFCGKKEACLPVLYHCRNKYLEKSKQKLSEDEADIKSEFEDFSDDSMVEIYIAICRVYFEKNQVAFFDELVQELIKVCEKLNKKPYYTILGIIGASIGNYEMTQTATICVETAEEGDTTDNLKVLSAYNWPHNNSNVFHVQESIASVIGSQLAASLWN